MELPSGREGVWRCRTIFNCPEACPREIGITRAIGEVKKGDPEKLPPRRAHPPRGRRARVTGGG
jgi:succinate dehydrogenase/fumarate reductase-like Fe-S protein